MEALAHVTTGEVTRASRDAAIDGVAVRDGDWLGLVDDRAVVAGDDFEAVAEDVVERALQAARSVLTLLSGDEDLDVARSRRLDPRSPSRTSRSTSTTADSRTTRCSCSRSRFP